MIPIPPIGSLIKERYRVDDILDATGDCIVLKCFDTRLDVMCVLKRLMTETKEPEFEAKQNAFVEAVRAQARLNHPGIVNVSDIQSKEELTYSVMELLNGMTLAQFLETTELTHKEIVEVFLSVVDAVNTAHNMQILHKSISPRTIFMNRLGNRLAPKLLNMGQEKDPALLDPHTVLPYLAPEQIFNFRNSKPASDIFAISASMYFAFMHRPPICFDSYEEYCKYYKNGGKNIEFPDSIPQDFAQLIRSGLSINPMSRIVSAAAYLKSLKNIGAPFNLSANLTIDATRTSESKSGPSIQSRTGSISAASGERRIAPATGQIHIIQSSNSFGQKAFSELSIPQGTGPKTKRPTYTSNPSFQAFADSILPQQLAQNWKIRRIDSQQEHACICAVSRFDEPDSISILKFMRSDDPNEMSVFNESVQRTFILARECPFYQNIIRDYAECAAFLSDDVPRTPLPTAIQNNGLFYPITAAQTAIQIAQAMERAHQRGFVNGNLKPSNILFETRDNAVVPVIYDFGQKLYINSAEKLQYADIAFVDPAIDYNLQNTNVQSDIYSFGMLLIYMLFGRIPFNSNNSDDLINEIDTLGTIPNLYAWRNDLSQDFIQFIYWCTAFNPEQRYRNFTDVLRDLYVLYNQLQYPQTV